jgi:hypothetical protein
MEAVGYDCQLPYGPLQPVHPEQIWRRKDSYAVQSAIPKSIVLGQGMKGA